MGKQVDSSISPPKTVIGIMVTPKKEPLRHFGKPLIPINGDIFPASVP